MMLILTECCVLIPAEVEVLQGFAALVTDRERFYAEFTVLGICRDSLFPDWDHTIGGRVGWELRAGSADAHKIIIDSQHEL